MEDVMNAVFNALTIANTAFIIVFIIHTFKGGDDDGRSV